MAGLEGSSPSPAAIRPISKAAIHRICSGQVILDLSSAVKELVENSLDAGSSVVEVSLKEYGEEHFKVIDNGSGISPNNFQSLALKHHTSKLSAFTDLHSLTTFGFRGEALSSLCALGSLSVETRTKDEPMGTHLTFDHSGAVVRERKIARQVGTTVTVEKLFSPLPVRSKEFSRNIKREYGKLITLLNAYALVSKRVRLLCMNTTSKGSKSVVLKTQGSSTLKDNIINIFGLNTFQCLAPLNITLSEGCSIEGFISKPGNGNGRNSGDRQFFYVNSRPVDMPKVAKMINELYKGSNSKQYPISVLNFCLPTDSYDVNVTPDKRKVFFSSEGSLMVSLREELEKVYSPDQCVYSVNSVEKNSKSESLDDMEVDDLEKELLVPYCKVSAGKKGSVLRDFDQFTPEVRIPKDISAYRFVDLKRSSGSPEEIKMDGNSSRKLSIVQSSLSNFVTFNKRKHEDEATCNPLSEVPVLRKPICSGFGKNELTGNSSAPEIGRKRFQDGVLDIINEDRYAEISEYSNSDTDVCVEHDLDAESGRKPEEFELASKSNTKFRASVGREVDDSVVGSRLRKFQFRNEKDEASMLARCGNHCRDPDMEGTQETITRSGAIRDEITSKQQENPNPPFDNDVLLHGDKDGRVLRPSTVMVTYRPVCFSMEEMRRRREHRLSVFLSGKSSSLQKGSRASRNYKVATMEESQPVDEEGKARSLAEALVELERFFNKEDFAHMQVIGQFNLGFIIGKIEQDLFIIDQHAADEKYNYERLSQSTTFNLQPLLQPIRMELSPEDEVVASMHMDLIRKNGFVVAQDANAAPGHQFLLKAVPFSKNITFGAEDLKELISALVDGKGDCAIVSSYKLDTSDSLCPSRVRTMLASRACRTSCMVGDALTKTDMQKILANLAMLRSPWNCPHGRPTMRHLVDLSTVRKEDAEKLFREFCKSGIAAKNNLHLHRYSNESWPVALPPVPFNVPDSILGNDVQCDDMPRGYWLEGAVRSDSRLLYPSFHLGACFVCNKGFRMKFDLINDLPKMAILVTGDPIRIRDSSDPKKVSRVPPEQKEADAKSIEKGEMKSSPLYDMDPCQLRQMAGILKVDSEKINLGYSDVIRQVAVPAGLSPLLPSAAVGINFACNGMSKKNWKELFNLRIDLPTICKKVNEAHSPLEEGEEEHERDAEQGGGEEHEVGQGGEEEQEVGQGEGDEQEAGQGGGEEQEAGQGGEEEDEEEVGDDDDDDDDDDDGDGATEHQVLEALAYVWVVRIDIKSKKNKDPHEFAAAVCIDKEGYLIAMPLFPINGSLMFNQEKYRFYASMDSFQSEIEVDLLSVDENSRTILLKLPDSNTPYMNANFAEQKYHAYQKMHTVILKLNPMLEVDFDVNYLTHWISRILKDLTLSSGENFSDMDEELPILQIGGVMDDVGKNVSDIVFDSSNKVMGCVFHNFDSFVFAMSSLKLQLIWVEYQNNMKGGGKRKRGGSRDASPKRRKF